MITNKIKCTFQSCRNLWFKPRPPDEEQFLTLRTLIYQRNRKLQDIFQMFTGSKKFQDILMFVRCARISEKNP